MTNLTMDSLNGSVTVSYDIVTVVSVISGVAIAVCSLAAVLVCALRLYRRFVYRLALYQVVSSLMYAVTNLLSVPVLLEHSSEASTICSFVAFVHMYCVWAKLLTTVWVSLHLFCFAVCYKDMKRREALGVIVSVAVPLVISVIPFMTHSYGLYESRCGINNKVILILLWYVPALVFLSINALAVVFLLTILLLREKRLSENTSCTANSGLLHKQQTLLHELLPLLAYPIVFFLLLVPSVVTNIVPASSNLELVNATFASLVSLAAGVALLIHILVVIGIRWKTNISKRVPLPIS